MCENCEAREAADPRLKAIVNYLAVQTLTKTEAEKVADSKTGYVDTMYYTDLTTATFILSAKQSDPDIAIVRPLKVEISLN